MNAQNKPGRLQFKIDLALSALFLLAIFFFGIMTLATDFQGIYKAASSKTQLSAYVDDVESAGAWDLLSARVKSVDAYLAANVYSAERLGYLNSSFQYALGKRVIATGASQMIRLNTGHLYDLQSAAPMADAASDILAMRDALPADTPFLFVYEHPTLYSDAMMPEGYGVLDHSAEIADEITSRLRAAGVELIDSRETLISSGLAIEDYLMYTDQHWATRAAMVMAQDIARRVREMTGAELDAQLLDIDRFEVEAHEKLFLGKYGQRIGTANVDPDDIYVYWPKYETRITRHTQYLEDTFDLSGSFRDSVIRWKYLEPDAGKSWNRKAYFDYGLTENYDIFTNPDAPDCTILLLKDSYSAPIGAFLSLVARNVISVDARRAGASMEEWAARSDPDIVVVAYSMQMLRDEQYEFQ